ncbi:Zinc finger protein GAI-ASSOCIATED FACTOR 1 [Hirschfeldia incana]|nr:Zinc finger protein GAI-ASSOCIATED FACTOR 1 [Hirschfeldia incana]KAJ0253662.1 Zinc finger protein GAI-ASSOCIATED FACTOR 1 [Hirschfeldia incana]KAJ0253663.1 Zinc finger protein GAI-ASSOCIATED FACTOR 1 [Hirschfeldia incana]KAJ0253664.1 Zinc finger protein GAI-ASSOCIATED FACTOR 1 [Hirschfeldia incana]KAJ0253665.1 Zinc finger protein GAI-ASSOCIATED FACTOR 1 [Hirschfeldia incana]
MPVDLDNSSTVSGEASVSSTGNQQNPLPKSAVKKKRNLPGMPDPDSEVIALSPKTLLATNRFVCEICNKGFQRDQNLQLHRRGHNLPWKLRQKSSKEVKKKVYVCPETSCVHHDPSRALGDLTGIKKHFCRKHGEKKWKCDKCSKRYAVVSDWKAHSKICGTKEYKCDCGTLFSRRDSFMTHRAFCDALAEESSRNHTHSKKQRPEILTRKIPVPDPESLSGSNPTPYSVAAPVETQSAKIISPRAITIKRPESPKTPREILQEAQEPTGLNGVFFESSSASPSIYAVSSSCSQSLFAPSSSIEPISLGLSASHGPSFLCSTRFPTQPAMSATALLQKAAQMGAASSGGSLLRGLGIVSSTSPSVESLVPHGLALGLPCGGESSSGLKELMMGNSSVFGPKQTTLDFLGLGRAVGNGGGGGGGPGSALVGPRGSIDALATFGSGEFSGHDIGRRTS